MHTSTHDRLQRPAFLRLEVDAVSIESEVAPFADNVRAHFTEWDALPQVVKDHLNFDRFLT